MSRQSYHISRKRFGLTKPKGAKRIYDHARSPSQRIELSKKIIRDAKAYGLKKARENANEKTAGSVIKQEAQKYESKYYRLILWQLSDPELKQLFVTILRSDLNTPAYVSKKTGIDFEIHEKWMEYYTSYRKQIAIAEKMMYQYGKYLQFQQMKKGDSSAIKHFLDTNQSRDSDKHIEELEKIDSIEIIF